MRKVYILAILTCLACSLRAQNTLNSITDSLTVLMKSAVRENSAEVRDSISALFSGLLEKALKMPGSFDHSFDSIPHLGILSTPDGMVKIYSWGFFASDLQNNYKYHGIVQRKRLNKNNPLTDIFVLTDVKDSMKFPDTQVLQYPNWFGCIYYDVVEKRDAENQTIYTLIGYDFNNNITRKKYIDVLTFTKEGFPVFGAPVFIEDRAGLKTRIEFEYSAQSVMMVRYFADIDKIAFNYLYPVTRDKEGDKSYYVPDTTHDGFEFKFDKWMKVKNVKVNRKGF